MRSIADVSAGVVRAEIEIEGTPEDVFDALTDPAQLASWWGGDLYRTYDWQIDLRPGGAWSVKAEGPNGRSTIHGEYLEIDRPRRLVYTWLASWDGEARTVIRIDLTPIASGTRVVVVHDGFAGRREQCEGHALGWQNVLGWLGAHVASAALGRPRS
jgi:uncharacterized protein YndB with AHSA1/START domain